MLNSYNIYNSLINQTEPNQIFKVKRISALKYPQVVAMPLNK